MKKAEVKNKSLGKALSILDCFIDKRLLGITEISELLELNKSNVHDIISTFVTMGYLEQDEQSGKYTLGTNSVRLGRAAMLNNPFYRIASAHLRKLSDVVPETCYLTAPSGFSVCYIDVVNPNTRSAFVPVITNTRPDSINSTASGKSMLAYMPNDFVEAYFENGMPNLTENTITDPEIMRKELEQIRLCGYAIDNMENTPGIRCVAVPLLSSNGDVLGAMSVSGPVARMSDEYIEKYSRILIRHAAEIRTQL